MSAKYSFSAANLVRSPSSLSLTFPECMFAFGFIPKNPQKQSLFFVLKLAILERAAQDTQL